MATYRIALGCSKQFAAFPRSGNLLVTTTRRSFAAQQQQPVKSQQIPKARSSNGRTTLKLALIGVTVGGITGTVYSIYNNWKDKSTHMEHQRMLPKIIDVFPPGVQITKRFVNPKDTTGLDVTLFQFQTCPFCCKVRAFLDYMGISYAVVEVDAVLRQDIKWSEQKKVPMILVRQRDGRYIQMTDSSAIISMLASFLLDRQSDVGEYAQFYPVISFFDDFDKRKMDIMNKYHLMYQDHTPKKMTGDMQESERKWRTWADNHLVHLISPNCYRTLSEAFETFDWFSKSGEWDVYFPTWERNLMVYVGATAMWAIAKLLKKRHGLSDDVRSHLYDALNKWTNELEKRKIKFMGGKEPNLADLSVFGVLSSMEGCEAFKDCLKNTDIGVWYFNVKELVQKNRGELKRGRIVGNAPAAINASIA